MKGRPSPGREWRRVNTQTPCGICGKPDWCTATVDDSVTCCMRIGSSHQLRNGGWLHRVADHVAPRKFPSIDPASPAAQQASPDQRNRVYRALARELGLLSRHREHLREVRNLPPLALEAFASTPSWNPSRRREIALLLIDRFGGEDSLRGVPGFFVNQSGHWTCRTAPRGFLIPVPDLLGRIQAYQVRYDDAASDGRRYAWYSSRGMPGGSSPGVPAAVWQPELIASAPIWITEGSLKAAVAARHLHGCVIGVSGVSNWRGAVELLPAKTPVVIAFDADALTNRTVAHHRTSLARALFWAGHPVAIATWDRRFKGIDDALASGATIEQHTWPIGQVLNRNGTTVRLLVPEKPANAVRLSEYIR